MEDGLVPLMSEPYLSWIWGLNPYCSGRWSRTVICKSCTYYSRVLILIVVEDGLVPVIEGEKVKDSVAVLILIVVEDGLVLVHYERF